MTVGSHVRTGDQLRGRHVERKLVRDFVEGPGGLRVMSVLGMAGIGKSSLWAQGIADATDSGTSVLVLACAEVEADMPYAALSDLVRDLLLRTETDLPKQLREAADHALVGGGHGTDPRRLARAVLTLLQDAARRGPVLLAVDDRQWLDADTELCLAFALRRLRHAPVRLLLSTRTASPLTPQDTAATPRWLLEDLADGQELILEPFDAETARQLLRDRHGRELSIDECQGLVEETGGNPFWLLEFDRARHADDGQQPSATLTGLARSRFADVPGPVFEAACLVAALGRPFPATVRRELERGHEDVEATLDEAVVRGLLTVSRDRVVVGHPILGAALLAALPPFRRRRLHQRVAALADSAEERAKHLLAAAAIPAPHQDASGPDLLAVLDEASDSAQARGSLASAASFAHHALGLVARPATDRALRVAELLYRTGSFARALDTIRPLTPAALDDEQFERATLLLGDLALRLAGTTAVAELSDRLRRLTGSDTLRRRHAIRMMDTDLDGAPNSSPTERLAQAERTANDAERLDASPYTRRRALALLVRARLDHGLRADRALDDLRSLDTHAPALTASDATDILVAESLVNDDRLDDAVTVLADALDGLTARGDEVGAAGAASALAYAQLSRGRINEAMAVVEERVDHRDPATWDASALLVVWSIISMIRRRHGDVRAAIAEIERHSTDNRQRARLSYLRGAIAIGVGDMAAAAEHFSQYVVTVEAAGTIDPNRRLLVDPLLAVALIAQGRLEDAREVADHLDKIARRTGREATRGQERRVRAQLALHDGHLGRAWDLATDAVRCHERSPRVLDLAMSLHVLADVAARLDRHTTARDAAARARNLLRDAGIPIENCVSVTTPRIGSVLSASEQKVARLVADGASNRDAAAKLHLSVRTVENHLHSAYRKLGVHRRDQLGQHLAEPESTGRP